MADHVVSLPLRIADGLSRLRAHRHFVLIAIIFLTFRLAAPFAFRTVAPIGDHMRWGALADSQLYPFVHYWSEYPPLFTWSLLVLYRLNTLLPAWSDQRFWFSVILQWAMSLFDLGSLTLVYAIALQSGNRARAIRASAMFGSAFVIAYAASGWYDSVPLFFLLLALCLALRGRMGWSGLAASIGLLLKIVPILIVPAAVRYLTKWQQRLAYMVRLTVFTSALLLPFLLGGTDYILAFVRATLNRPSWLSIWAIFEGNYNFGAAAPTIDRFSPNAVGTPAASQIPWPVIHLAFIGLFLFIYTRRINWRDPAKAIALAGLTICLFLLWSKGFSGQFTIYLLPFIALLIPNERGALYLALLSLLWVAEWPIAFQIMDGLPAFIAWLVITRTAIVVALCLEFIARLNIFRRLPSIGRGRSNLIDRSAQAILLISWLSVVPASIISISTYTHTQLASDPASPAIDLIRAQSRGPTTIVFANIRIFRRLYPSAQSVAQTVALPDFNNTPEEVRIAWLNEIEAHGPFWFVDEGGDPGTQSDSQSAEAWVTDRACKVETTWAGSARVSRFAESSGMLNPVSTTAVFAEEVALTNFRLNKTALHPGEALCLELNWQALQTPSGDYTIFVHIVNSSGQIVAQNDMQPQGGFTLTSQWAAGQTAADRHGLILPEKLPVGEYAIQVGLSRTDNGTIVHATHGDNVMPDATGIVLPGVQVIP